jgi:hypothetical protein
VSVDAPTSAEAGAGGRSATWWMAVLFAACSACFVVASIPGFVKLVGTLYFNVTTFRAFQTGLDADEYDKLVWTPDAIGSVCFLVSSYLACVEISGLTARPRRTRDSAIATANLVASVAFGIAAVASYVVADKGSALDLAGANIFTALGGLCFLAGALLLLPRRATS